MNNLNVFNSPNNINYGRNSFKKIGEIASTKGKKALIISDKTMKKLNYVDQCKKFLLDAEIKSVEYLGVEAEPIDLYVSEALEVLNEESCDFVISLGGGSCIDTAKSVAVLASNGGNIEDYVGMKNIPKNKSMPHIAIPTTAGTGSEATDVTIIKNSKNDVKMMIKHPAFLPESAIVDPMLTLSTPKAVTAATGIDALSHAIEAYISKKSQPLTDMMALSAMNLIINNITKSFKEDNNIDAKENMIIGSLQAGLAFSNASVCLVHGMSRPIGALFHVPHGISNAMLLPAVMEFSKDSAIDRLADIGAIFDPNIKSKPKEIAADFAVSSVKELCHTLNIPNLRDWGIDKEKFDASIDKMITDALNSGSPQNNPKVPSYEEIESLYYYCFDYKFSV